MAQQQINQTNSKIGSTKKGLFLSAGAILLAVLILVSLKIYNNHLNNKNNYHYQNLSSQSSTPTTVGTLSFDKPNEFTQTHKQTQNGTTTVVYSDVDKAGYTIGLLGVSVSASDKASDSQYVDGVNYLMKEGSGSDYDTFTGYFTGFIGGISGSDYSIALGQPKSFTNDNIKSNAWAFDINATATGKLAPMQGKFIYATGKKNFYYFTVLALQSNWQPNSAVWDQLTNSLKISE